MGLKVRKTQCATCIFRSDGPYSEATPGLVEQCRDQHGFLVKYRLCHSHHDLCCRGFYDAHGAECTMIQLADRLGVTEFTNDAPVRDFGNEDDAEEVAVWPLT